MSPNAAPVTAIERARLAYDMMKRRQHGVEVQRRARERSRNIILAAVVAAALLLVAGIAIYNGGMPDSLRATAHEGRGDKTRTSDSRTGQVRSYVKGNTCRELQFNNDSGTFVGGSLVLCDPGEKSREPSSVQAQPPTPNGARLNSIRGGFAR
jgi:hypothetical protein